MPQGFGSPTTKQLGYVLMLVPSADAYAAKFSIGEPGEKFIGVTNLLEKFQVWKHLKQAERAVSLYEEFIEELVLEDGEAEVFIRTLHKTNKEIQVGKIVRKLVFSKQDFPHE